MSVLLTSTFWLLLNTPMIPPEPKPRTNAVPMVNLRAKKSSRRRRASNTSVDSNVSSVSSESEGQPEDATSA
ncbi:hypothetical protein C8Q78DRAFT_1153847 [Trametes maxima]|nr:hypothetical protein C8Q78DRAFT_1153847 [Trametes maxima]